MFYHSHIEPNHALVEYGAKSEDFFLNRCQEVLGIYAKAYRAVYPYKRKTYVLYRHPELSHTSSLKITETAEAFGPRKYFRNLRSVINYIRLIL